MPRADLLPDEHVVVHRTVLRALRSLALIVLAVLGTGAAVAAERITAFQSDIQVLSDGGLEVVETISVIAQGKTIRRGIYRDFPVRYRTASGASVRVSFDVVSVRRNGMPESWFTESRGNSVRLYLGRKEVLIEHGEHRYEITYRTHRQLGFFGRHDELYWNVTGNDWAFPIENALAYVYLPKTVPDDRIEVEAYTGPRGAKGSHYEAGIDRDGVAWFATTRALRAGEGLTIVTTWPKGHVREPSKRDQARWFLEDNGQLLAGLLGVALLLVYYLVVWSRAGRDPRPGVVFPRYEPPTGYSPASLRYVSNMGYDDRVFTAALVNLAVEGHIRIEEDDDGEFSIDRLDSDAKLAPGEKALLSRLVGRRGSLRLKRSNHARIRRAIDAHTTRLAADYETKYFNTNLGYTLGGLFISLAILVAGVFMPPGPPDLFGTLFMLVWLGGWSFGVFTLVGSAWRAWRAARGLASKTAALVITAFAVPFIGAWFAGAGALWSMAGSAPVMLCVVLLGVNALFYQLMKAPTVLGRELLDQIAGFEEYLSIAEGDELRLGNPPRKTPELFERLLPYAIALDVEGVWGERFRSVLEAARARDGYQGPEWYRSSRGFSAHGLTSAVGGSLAAGVSASSRAPGSSSGSGGGGSSGGGGGGGGGGGW